VTTLDYASMGEAGARGGNDPRQWISNGVVNADQPGAPSVDFTSKAGPLVSVRLHPSDIDVRCRTASFIAGGGQGEWHPFVGGDEVLVALPMGSERAGAVIVGRLNNGVDVFPTNVANNDVTANNITTRRTIPNYAWETTNGWILRNITTGAQLALDVTGQWTMNSGDLHFMQIGSTGVTLSLKKMTSYITLDATTGQITLNVGPGKARFTMDPATGNIYVGTQGTFPVGHVATVEGMVAFVAAALTTLGALVLPTPISPAQVIAAVESAIPLSGITPPYATFAGLVMTALAVPRDQSGQVQPGLGCAGMVV
jgi:hypothetical protein